MAGGSTRTAFHVAFARDNNIADITAKATSQTIATSLLGTTAGKQLLAGWHAKRMRTAPETIQPLNHHLLFFTFNAMQHCVTIEAQAQRMQGRLH